MDYQVHDNQRPTVCEFKDSHSQQILDRLAIRAHLVPLKRIKRMPEPSLSDELKGRTTDPYHHVHFGPFLSFGQTRDDRAAKLVQRRVGRG